MKQQYDPKYVQAEKEREKKLLQIMEQVRSVQGPAIRNKKPGLNAQAYLSGTIRIG